MKRFLCDEAAVTSVEYAVILAALLLVALIGIRAVGTETGDLWTTIDGDLDTNGLGNSAP